MSYHGHDSYLTYGKEDTFGTKANNVDTWIGIVKSFSPEEENNVQKQYGLGSRNFMQARQGQKSYSGSIEYLVQDLHMMEFVLGTVSDDGMGTYTFTEANDLPSVTFQAGVLGTTDFVRDYIGSKIDTLSLTAEKEEALTAEIDFISKDMDDTVSTGTQPVADTSSYFMFYEGTVTVDGQTQALVEEFELEISNGLETLYAVNGEQTPARIQEGNRENTLSLSFIFEDTAQWELWKNGTEFDVELSFTAPDGRTFTVTSTGCQYDSNELELGSEDYMVQELEAVVKSVSATYTEA